MHSPHLGAAVGIKDVIALSGAAEAGRNGWEDGWVERPDLTA